MLSIEALRQISEASAQEFQDLSLKEQSVKDEKARVDEIIKAKKQELKTLQDD